MKDTIAVYSLWRDSEPHIHKTLAQLESLESLDYDFEYFFYENDSKDNTVDILNNWMSKRKGVFVHENIKAKKFVSDGSFDRMTFLTECRNKCKSLGASFTSKYCLLIDSDIEFNNDNFIQQINLLNELDDAVAITPNVRQINVPDLMCKISPDSFYDLHALIDINGERGFYFTDCPFTNFKDRFDWALRKPIRCISSFGGFFVLRNEHFQQVQWSTNGDCEHINFCKELLKFGSIYLDPSSKVHAEPDLTDISMEACQQIANYQLNFLR
jgi:hypothetical protein